MSGQHFSVEALRRRTTVNVDGAWNAHIVATVQRRVRRRRRMGQATVAVAALLVLGGGAWWRLSPAPQPSVALRQTPAPGRASAPGPAAPDALSVRFDDGATGQLASAASRAVVTERSSAHTTVAIHAGAVTFDIAHTGREFRVDAGAIRVVVVGTAFVVDRRDDGVRVSVRRGRVRVESAGDPSGELARKPASQTVTISAGEEHWFPAPGAEPALAPPTATATPATAMAPLSSANATDHRRAGVGALRHPTPRWRVLAQRGDFHRAYRLLARAGAPPRDDVEELLLAADVARRSSHFAEALPYYDRVITSHAADPRAALAALTKGRIALHRLGKPRDAAGAFAQSRALGLPDALAEEAMLGEITAWRRAGDSDRARAVAAAYVQRYPRSPSVENLRRLGDLR